MMNWAQNKRSLVRFRTCVFSVSFVLALSMVGNPSWARGLERFHFDYGVYGVGQPISLQIFDDGMRTFLLWDEFVDVPRIQDETSKTALTLAKEGSYWVIQGVHSHMLLRFGQGYFHVLDTSGPGPSLSTMAQVQLDLKAHTPYQRVALDEPSPQSPKGRVANSYAKPIRGDDLSWNNTEGHPDDRERWALVPFSKGSKLLGTKAKEKVREFLSGKSGEFELTVVGYEDDSYVEDLGRDRARAILQFLLGLGVRAERVKLQMEPFTELRDMNPSFEPIAAKITWHSLNAQTVNRENNTPSVIKQKQPKDESLDAPSQPLPIGAVKSEASSKAELNGKVSEPSPVIHGGELIHEGLERFAKSRNWTLMWRVNWDWKAVADVDLSKGVDAVDAVSKVIEALRLEGHALELRVYEDNQVMEVVTTEVFND